MRRLFALLLCLALTIPAALPAACEEETLMPLSAYLTDELYALADRWPSCDDRALAKVMRKAAAGEAVTIAVLGGSITEGTISRGADDAKISPRLPYAELFRRWWAERFPETEIRFINAGIGGTDSYLGLHRVQREVLDFHPDLVLVEFAVNDDGSRLSCQIAYDNLVRTLLLSEDAPAVMLLIMGQTSGATAQDSESNVAYQYKLPVVSYINVIKQMMKEGVYTAEQLSGDVVHPSALGHAITGEILWRYLNGVFAERDSLGEPEPLTRRAVTTDKYHHPAILSARELTPDSLGSFTQGTRLCRYFPDGWTTLSGEGGLSATMTFRSLGLLYLRTPDGQSGRFEVFVDGERVYTIDADFPGGWGNAITGTEVFSAREAAEHRVELRLAEGSAKTRLYLLGFMVSD